MLEFENIVKKYNGRNVLDDFSAKFEKGRVYTLVSPNGHGKTTLMKIACNLVKYDSGICKINGKAVSPQTNASVSYMPAENYFYKNMNTEDIGKYYQSFYKDFDMKKYKKLIKFMDLGMKMKPFEMSTGMCAKLKVCLAVSRNSDIMMLDEPLNGIDIIARDMIIQAIIKAVSDEACVIISTHIFDEIESVADSIVMIKEGKNILQGDLEDIRMERGLSISDLYRELFSKSLFADSVEEVLNV